MKQDKNVLVIHATARILKRIRLEKNLSHATVAQLAGISRAAVSHIENGKRSPTLLVAFKISFALGTSLSAVLKEAENLKPTD